MLALSYPIALNSYIICFVQTSLSLALVWPLSMWFKWESERYVNRNHFTATDNDLSFSNAVINSSFVGRFLFVCVCVNELGPFSFKVVGLLVNECEWVVCELLFITKTNETFEKIKSNQSKKTNLNGYNVLQLVGNKMHILLFHSTKLAVVQFTFWYFKFSLFFSFSFYIFISIPYACDPIPNINSNALHAKTDIRQLFDRL